MAAKPTRSPVLGFNHNVKYRGRVFHVQTEDSGPINPRIFTHLYYGGTILASKKHEYDAAVPEDVVRSLMQSQHKSILKELKSARHDERIERFFTARGETLEPAAPVVMADAQALDLDAAPPGRSGLTPVTPAPVVFADTFEDEPTTPDGQHRGGTVTPPPLAASGPSDTLPASVAANLRRRPARVTPALGAPVVVQRTVSVGGGGTGTTGTFAGRAVPRGRKPAPAIPYVVKEGTHPLADTPGPDLRAPAVVSAARPMTPSPVTAQNAPLTSALPPRRAPPGPEPVVEKSLDEVILAYLAQGGENETR